MTLIRFRGRIAKLLLIGWALDLAPMRPKRGVEPRCALWIVVTTALNQRSSAGRRARYR